MDAIDESVSLVQSNGGLLADVFPSVGSNCGTSLPGQPHSTARTFKLQQGSSLHHRATNDGMSGSVNTSSTKYTQQPTPLQHAPSAIVPQQPPTTTTQQPPTTTTQQPPKTTTQSGSPPDPPGPFAKHLQADKPTQLPVPDDTPNKPSPPKLTINVNQLDETPHFCVHLEAVEEDCQLDQVLGSIAAFNDFISDEVNGDGDASSSSRTGSFPCGFEDCECDLSHGLVMCLSCGCVACDRYGNEHALQHYKETKHPIVLNLETKQAYCHECFQPVIQDEGFLRTFRRKLMTADDRVEVSSQQSSCREGAASSSAASNGKRRRDKKPTSSSTTKKKSRRAQVPMGPGLVGLSNLGNSCFMNSVIQALCSTNEFRDAVLGDQTVEQAFFPTSKTTTVSPAVRSASLSPRYLQTLNDSKDVSVYLEWSRLVHQLWAPLEGVKQSSIVEPVSFFSAVSQVMPYFAGYHQQDAHEFLRYLCDRLHWECSIREHHASRPECVTPPPEICHEENKDTNLSPPTTPNSSSSQKSHVPHRSLIKDIFGCTLVNEMKCLTCGYTSKKVDPCLDLSLDIPGAQFTVYLTGKGDPEHDDVPVVTHNSDKTVLVSEHPSVAAGLDQSGIPRHGPQDASIAEEGRSKHVGQGGMASGGVEEATTSPVPGQVSKCDTTPGHSNKPLPEKIDHTLPTTTSEFTARPCRLSDCLKSFTKCERLKVGEQYTCEKCQDGQQPTTRSLRINTLPDVLCLQLKRFRWSMTSNAKVQRYVQFPIRGLSMSSYAVDNVKLSRQGSGPGQASRPGDKALVYDLYAVVVHHGSGFGSGHYTAYCLNFYTNQWWHYNDSVVTPVDEEVVARCQAYLLFYQVRCSASKARSPGEEVASKVAG